MKPRMARKPKAFSKSTLPLLVATFLMLLFPATSSAVRSAYVVNYLGAGTVSQYDLNLTTGELTAKSPVTVGAGTNPWDVALSPDGKSAYVTNATTNTVSQYYVDQGTGKLTAKNPTMVAAGTTPISVALSSDGKSAYVTNYTTNNVSQYEVNSTTGALSPKNPAAVEAGTNPIAIALSADGRNAFSVPASLLKPDTRPSQLNPGAPRSLQVGGILPASSHPPVKIPPSVEHGVPGPAFNQKATSPYTRIGKSDSLEISAKAGRKTFLRTVLPKAKGR